MQIKPLTRLNQNGEVLQRLPEVDAQIALALTTESNFLLEQARVEDTLAPSFIKEETLVYIIRENLLHRNLQLVNDLTAILLSRSSVLVESVFKTLDETTRQDASQEVAEQLVKQLINLESDKSDFLQVRYWFSLKRIALTIFGKYCRQSSKDSDLIPSSLDDGRTLGVPWEDIEDPSTSIEDAFISEETKAIGMGLLDKIREPYRTAFRLRYEEGWQIESLDPYEPTISKYFNKTPRTIRNWLTSVQNQLERGRDEQHV